MTNPHKGRTGLDRITHATGYSLSGLQKAYRGESAFRQETWLAVVLIPSAFWLGQDWTQRAILISSVALVLIVELLNSGIEAVVDRVSFEHHELSGRAKDIASAAVFVSLMLCGGLFLSALWMKISA
ncbi:MAG: diacylglycerol kinase [Ideonella sp.]|nr:diacylglycerol kinase [Ideonella sp.]